VPFLGTSGISTRPLHQLSLESPRSVSSSTSSSWLRGLPLRASHTKLLPYISSGSSPYPWRIAFGYLPFHERISFLSCLPTSQRVQKRRISILDHHLIHDHPFLPISWLWTSSASLHTQCRLPSSLFRLHFRSEQHPTCVGYTLHLVDTPEILRWNCPSISPELPCNNDHAV
jgi:hypothetical protein